MSDVVGTEVRFRKQKRRINIIVAAISIVALVAVYLVIRPQPPGRRDFDVSVFKAYPGSTLLSEDFEKAESGRTIDMERFSNPSWLKRTYQLAAPVTVGELDKWILETFPPPGWNGGSSSTQLGWHNYGTTVGKRSHSLEVVALGRDSLRDSPVTQYQIVYKIR